MTVGTTKPDLSPPKRLKYAMGNGPGRISSPINYAENGLEHYMKNARNKPGSLSFEPLSERSEHDKARFWAMFERSKRSSGAAGQFDE